jgi:hypothetical protein
MSKEKIENYRKLNIEFVKHYDDTRKLIDRLHSEYSENENNITFKDFTKNYFRSNKLDKFFNYYTIIDWDTTSEIKLMLLDYKRIEDRKINKQIKNLNAM